MSMKNLLDQEFEMAKNPNAYYPIRKVYKYFPQITGCPTITAEKYRPYFGTSKMDRKIHLRIKKAPRYAFIRKLINYPWRRMGSPQISIVGNLGTGKSVLMNLFLAFILARGIKVIMFDNSRFESRNLAPHGVLKRGKFIPFAVDCLVPKDYKFKETIAHNPLWNHRSNVNMIEYSNADKIINSMKPYHLTVVYDECFNAEGKLKLFSDLLTILAEYASINRNYMFAHHELSSLIPENPTKETYKLTQDVSKQIVNVRKDRIGLLTCFHMTSEVFFRITRKFSYVCYKQPTNKASYIPVERDAKRLSISQVNISRHEYWMTHDIGYFQGLPDMFRIIPNRKKLSYPSLKTEDESSKKDTPKERQYSVLDLNIAVMRGQGKPYRVIAKELGKSLGYIHERAKNAGLTEI